MSYKDPEKQKESQHSSYLRNKDRVRQRTKDSRIQKKAYVDDYKRQRPCALCGENDLACKDMHHLQDKEISIAQAIRDWSMDRMKSEMDKCQVVCANCHRKTHGKIGQTTANKKRIENREFVSQYKNSHCCERCGEKEELCLEFHHCRGKEMDISRAVVDYGLERLKNEILRCIVLCANCHRKLHYEE